jgi:hypothetical protein
MLVTHGPILPTLAMQQVGSFLRYTGRDENAVSKQRVTRRTGVWALTIGGSLGINKPAGRMTLGQRAQVISRAATQKATDLIILIDHRRLLDIETGMTTTPSPSAKQIERQHQQRDTESGHDSENHASLPLTPCGGESVSPVLHKRQGFVGAEFTEIFLFLIGHQSLAGRSTKPVTPSHLGAGRRCCCRRSLAALALPSLPYRVPDFTDPPADAEQVAKNGIDENPATNPPADLTIKMRSIVARPTVSTLSSVKERKNRPSAGARCRPAG